MTRLLFSKKKVTYFLIFKFGDNSNNNACVHVVHVVANDTAVAQRVVVCYYYVVANKQHSACSC